MVVFSFFLGVFDTSIIAPPPPMQLPFAQVLGRFTQKKAPGEVATPWGLGIYCIFLANCML
ncbi:hypothetical protein C4N26_14090 [Faecalibacterium prausnitzii]|uniref:Uncharacterized protein n=1 Tax=Faecalibacterium prausnitzii TaxID=853 RepID=A0A329TKV6_9FIRM|nr:hypothetical protein C4N26_14090 [Faecalibacterium prausnitzii]